jgi:predicted O-linked N-acetylglucosamine transferase (SPINDLY family)
MILLSQCRIVNVIGYVFFVAILLGVLSNCVNADSDVGVQQSSKAKDQDPRTMSPAAIRKLAIDLFDSGRHKDMMRFLDEVESVYGNLVVDSSVPSLYSYRGVALAGHSGSNSKGAVEAFVNATRFFPTDIKSWSNLGEARMYVYDMVGAEEAFLTAERLGSLDVIARLISVKAWTLSWKRFEILTSVLEKRVAACFEIPPTTCRWDAPHVLNRSGCLVDNVQGLEYTDVSPVVRSHFYTLSPTAATAKPPIAASDKASLWTNIHSSTGRRLKVGIVSSDFGIHPVVSLIRGFIEYANASRIELYCFSVSPQGSWWSENITRMVEPDHFVSLNGMNSRDAADKIAALGIEILIDLNGHTIKSGLPLMSFRPAPVQMTFLGWPSTSAATYIDYYIGDWVANPAEYASGYYEHLALLPPCYISNDYAQMQGHLVYLTGESRAPRQALEPRSNIDAATVLFATFSNSVKWDPTIPTVWFQILQRCPGSMLLLLDHEEMKFGFPHVQQQYGPYYGIHSSRVAIGQVIPWVDHLYAKTAVDMALDTISKNGHTTGLDAAWAGIPTVSMDGGQHSSNRAAESIAEALGTAHFTLSHSLKDYEDLVTAVVDDAWSTQLESRYEKYRIQANAKMGMSGVFSSSVPRAHRQHRSPWRLRILRDYVEQQRFRSSLFDTPTWSRRFDELMQAAWELEHLSELFHGTKDSFGTRKKYHIYGSQQRQSQDKRKRSISTHHTVDTAIGVRDWFPSLRAREEFQRRHGFDTGLPLERRLTEESTQTTLSSSHAGHASSTVDSSRKAGRVSKYHRGRHCADLQIYPADPTPLITPHTLLHIGRYLSRVTASDVNDPSPC